MHLNRFIHTYPGIVGWMLAVAAFGPRCNLGLSFVGLSGREGWRGEFNGRPHLCKSAVRAGDNQGLHTITPTHLSSGETLSDRMHTN